MRQVAFALLITTAVSIAIAAEEIPAKALQGRDLRAYHNGGVYRTPVNEPGVTGIDRLRRFVWTHWTEKRRGYVVVVHQGTDAGSESYLFIEPSGNQWHISWRIFGYSILEGVPERPPQELPDIVAVKRSQNTLIFLDAKDRVVTTL